ncbi:hypothetical protein DFH09DRAFT_1325845 [Mycena vulgaris]|nr:hypothetical protein DFH09DRAFT_1325845 [Mycena vulgaris]
MFSKLSVVVTSVLITLAAATPWNGPPRRLVHQCRRLRGCRSPRDIDLTGLSVPIGLTCSPITVGGNNWSAPILPFIHTPHLINNSAEARPSLATTPDKEWGGLIAINCIPITALRKETVANE